MWWARQRIHVSWLIAVMCTGVLVGVSMAPFVPRGLFANAAWLAVSLGFIIWALIVKRRYLIFIILLAGVIIGLWRSDGLLNDLSVYGNLVDREVILRGKILEDTDMDRSGRASLRLGDISIDGHRLPGRVWVTVTPGDLKRSDYITVKGVMSKAFGTFSGAIYRAETLKYESVTAGDVARDIRDKFSDQVQKYIDEPAVSLGLGYLTGQRRGLPPELLETLRIAGLTHVIVASGYNLTILVRLARRLLEKRSKYLAAVIPAGLVLGFVAVTGLSPSMSRAGLVTGLSLAAWYYGRRFHPLVLLSIVACLTVILEPSYAWGDVGWLLSFAAFAGVMILAPLLQAYFFGEKPASTLRQILGETMSAYVFTLPILALSFGEFSNVALMANLMILPLIPFVMLGVFTVGALSVIAGPLAAAVAWPVELVLDYMIWAAKLWAYQPWSTTEVSWGWGLTVGLYGILVIVCLYLRWVTKFSLRSSSIVD